MPRISQLLQLSFCFLPNPVPSITSAVRDIASWLTTQGIRPSLRAIAGFPRSEFPLFDSFRV